MAKLTLKQMQFVRNYIENGGNGTQAALDAGYARASAYSTASRMLKDAKIKAEIEAHETKLQQQIEESGKSLREKMVQKADDAFRTLIEIMQDKNANKRDRLNAAKDLLDRAGYKPIEKSEQNINVDHSDQRVAEQLIQDPQIAEKIKASFRGDS